MDDSYFIASDKETLWAFLDAAERVCASLGITINRRKTHVVKLSRGFVFLKKRFRFTPTGRIIVTPIRKSKTRQRHRMKAHARMLANGEMTVAQARTSYMSWRGGLVKKHGDGKPRLRMDVWHTVRSFDALFQGLFGEPPISRCKYDGPATANRKE